MKLFVLEGSWDEMGSQWGRFFADNQRVKEGFEYYSREPERVSAHLSPHNPVKRALLKWAFKAGLALLSGRVREEDRRFLKAFAEGMGFSSHKALSTFCFPDFFNCLLSISNNLLGLSIPHIPLGCSVFVAFDSATKDKALYHGRNLDYSGGRVWEKGHCILVMKPKNAIASVNVLSEGVYAPGITAINEEGLCVSVDLCFTRDVSFRRTPLLSLLSEIVSSAKRLRDVADILRKKKPLAGWAVTVSSASEKDAAVFELSASSVEMVHPENGILCYTNMYLSEGKKMKEYAPSYVWVENNYVRYDRLRQFLLENSGLLDEKMLIALLGDTYDPLIEREMAFANTISNAANISSALFCAEKDRLWVAEGDVPVNRKSFVEFSLSKLFSGKAEVLGELKGNSLGEKKERAFRYFVEACFSWEAEANLEAVIAFMDKAVEEDDGEPLYFFVRALFLLKAERIEEAFRDIEVVLKGPLTHYKRLVVSLWKARIYDLMGNREEAYHWYEKVVSGRAPLDLQKMAWKGIKKGYTRRMLKKMDVIPFLADFVDVL